MAYSAFALIFRSFSGIKYTKAAKRYSVLVHVDGLGYLSIRKGANATQFAASSVAMAKAKVKLSQYYFSGIYLPYHKWVFTPLNFSDTPNIVPTEGESIKSSCTLIGSMLFSAIGAPPETYIDTPEIQSLLKYTFIFNEENY